MTTSKRWPTVNRERPCPQCGKSDRCTMTSDRSAGHCFRQERTWFAEAKSSGNVSGGYLGKAHRPKTAGPSTLKDWKAESERLHAALTDDRLATLAESSGVPGSAWVLLSPGWVDAETLTTLRAGGAGWADARPDSAFSFAEHSGDGRVAGIALRAVDGRKGFPAGASRGLIVPSDLHTRPDPVQIVEGASDVAACCALGLTAVGRPSNQAGAEDLAKMLDSRAVLVVGENDNKPGGAWPGRDGAKKVAHRIAGNWGEPVRWTLPPKGIKDVREYLKAKLTGGLVASDTAAVNAAGVELLTALTATAKEAKPERRSQADALVDLARQEYRLGISSDGEAFAVANAGPAVAIPLRGMGAGLRQSLARLFRQTTSKTPSASALADAMTALDGMAADADPEPVALRMAEHEDGVVLDLGDASGRVVVVTSGGWAVEAAPPVLFRRTPLTAALPEPEQADTANLEDLRNLLNVDNDTWPLLIGWLVAALMPGVPHPVLLFGGEQGTGKSTAARVVLGLVDPSPAALRSEPRDAEQWAIAASGSWAVCIDNVSRISGWLSDALCKAVTGDGLVRRKLYTDSDLAALAFRRCIILTSIDPGAMRGDLGDRLLLADLERIDDSRRRTESDLWTAYNAARPNLLGALLTATARTLAALPTVHLATMPRMADFARILAALDVACPELTGGRALELFAGQRKRIASDVVESDPVALAIVAMTADRAEWVGPVGELLSAITPKPAPKGWPSNARSLAGHLRRIRPALAAVGIRHTPPMVADKTRRHRLERTCSEPPDRPKPSDVGDDSPVSSGCSPFSSLVDAIRPPTDRPSANGNSDINNLDSTRSGGLGGSSPALSGDNAELFAERAGIMEFDGGLDRINAERLARAAICR